MKSKKWIFVLCSFLASFFLVACQSGSNESQSAVEEEIKRMGRDVKNFVEAALELYLNGSVDQAYEVAAMDEKINHYFDSIRDLATEEIKKNPDAIVTGRDYFQVIAFLERIGDYAKNICEWVVYFETGKIVEL